MDAAVKWQCCCEEGPLNISDAVGSVPRVTGLCVALRQAVQANTGFMF